MRKLLWLFPVLFLSLSFRSNRVEEDTPELDQFIAEFKEAVMEKNKTRLMGLMDPAYRMEQHDKFHQGNTDRFLNELFCGTKVDQSGFKCIPLKKVRGIELATKGDDGAEIQLVFRVSDKKVKIDVLLVAILRMVNGEKVYGIRGAVG